MPTQFYPIQKLGLILLLLIGFHALAAAQTSSNNICENNDCAAALFDIQLDEPLQPTPANTFSDQRTENFKKAYLQFKQIKSTYAKDPAWQSKYQQSQIGGKNCLRHYQLESDFSHEYMQNPAFKAFIDGQGTESDAYVEEGFENSRRGINLEKRMRNSCPEEVKEADKNGGPSLEDLAQSYQKMGRHLGYFDEQGKLLKPLKSLTENPAVPKTDPLQNIDDLNKRQQIDALKSAVSQLPVGQQAKDKINQVKDATDQAKSKFGLLKTALGLMGSRLGTFLPGPLGLTSKIKSLNDALGVLKNFKPKLPFPGLLSKIGNLFNKGKNLGQKAKDLLGKSQKAKDKFDQINDQAKKLQDRFDDHTKALDDLEKKRADLEQKQKDLLEKLNDKPRKILEELKDQVKTVKDQADDFEKETTQENKKGKDLQKELEALEKEKKALEDDLKKLEKEAQNLEKEKDELEKETKALETEVAEAKELEGQVEELSEELEQLKPESEIEQEIDDCEGELKAMLLKISGLDKKQGKLKEKFNNILGKPKKLLAKVRDLKFLQEKLKLPKDGIPLAEKAMKKANDLLGKSKAVGSILETITGKESKLLDKIESYDEKLENIQTIYNDKTANAEQLKSDLIDLALEKSGLKEKLNNTVDNAEAIEAEVQDFIKRYNIFDEASDCLDHKDLEDKIEDLKKEQDTTEPEIEEIEESLDDIEQQEKELEKATEALEKEIEESVEQAKEIVEEEERIKDILGEDVELEPVSIQQWEESFEVERTYWDAVFHPDDEVVEGYKGRYFQVQLKDANRNIKLLFGPGEYFMSRADFRDNYGSTIGAFVTEATNAIKKSDREKVKIFIQGSADLAGQNTFSGELDESFYYDNISFLPQKGSERFTGVEKSMDVPKSNFRNTELPNLRGQFLKEMVQVYSKKLEPILLEGSVKDKIDTSDRNAVIYLFLPEALLEEN